MGPAEYFRVNSSSQNASFNQIFKVPLPRDITHTQVQVSGHRHLWRGYYSACHIPYIKYTLNQITIPAYPQFYSPHPCLIFPLSTFPIRHCIYLPVYVCLPCTASPIAIACILYDCCIIIICGTLNILSKYLLK